jgi:lipoate-protein ligase A
MTTWRYIAMKTDTGPMNMALDEAVLTAVIEKRSPPTLRFYRWEPSCVTIGRNQSLSAEVDEKTAGDHGIDVVRRITGGGAVFHDSAGEMTYAVACDTDNLEHVGADKLIDQSELVARGIISGLRLFGLFAEKGAAQCSAVFLEGKKISGNACLCHRHHFLQHGTLLWSINPDIMYSVLKAPHNISKKAVVRSVHSKCTGIGQHLGERGEEQVIDALKQGFEKTLHVTLKDGGFTDYEMRLAAQLRDEKYSNEKWLKKIE